MLREASFCTSESEPRDPAAYQKSAPFALASGERCIFGSIQQVLATERLLPSIQEGNDPGRRCSEVDPEGASCNTSYQKRSPYTLHPARAYQNPSPFIVRWGLPYQNRSHFTVQGWGVLIVRRCTPPSGYQKRAPYTIPAHPPDVKLHRLCGPQRSDGGQATV
jgi:hypothetical protein